MTKIDLCALEAIDSTFPPQRPNAQRNTSIFELKIFLEKKKYAQGMFLFTLP